MQIATDLDQLSGEVDVVICAASLPSPSLLLNGIAHDAHFYGALYGIVFTSVIQPHAIASFITAITGR